jgi:hypothetical protein
MKPANSLGKTIPEGGLTLSPGLAAAALTGKD